MFGERNQGWTHSHTPRHFWPPHRLCHKVIVERKAYILLLGKGMVNLCFLVSMDSTHIFFVTTSYTSQITELYVCSSMNFAQHRLQESAHIRLWSIFSQRMTIYSNSVITSLRAMHVHRTRCLFRLYQQVAPSPTQRDVILFWNTCDSRHSQYSLSKLA